MIAPLTAVANYNKTEQTQQIFMGSFHKYLKHKIEPGRKYIF